MDILSANEVAQIRSAIRDVTDTFLQIPVIYQLKQNQIDRFNEDAKPPTIQYSLVCLQIFSPNGTVQMTKLGKYDLTDGYILFNYQYLKEKEMIDPNGNFIGNANADFFIIQGNTYEITAINLLGPLKDTYSLVQMLFKNNMKA